MSKRTIKFEVSEKVFRAMEEEAKKQGKRSVSQLARECLDADNQSTSREPFFDLGDAKEELEREKQDKARRQYWANKKKNEGQYQEYNVGEEERAVTIGGHRDPTDYLYFPLGDRAYLLWECKGLNKVRLPSLGPEGAFWIDKVYTEREHYRDISGEMTEFELRWLEAWVDNFEVMDGYWWFKARHLTAMEQKWTMKHMEQLLTWLKVGKTLDELTDEAGVAKRPMKERIKEELRAERERELEAIKDLEQRQLVADKYRYEELEAERKKRSQEAREQAREQLALGLKLDLIKPKKERS